MGYRLAARLGGGNVVNVRKLLRGVTMRDLVEWETFYSLEPHGDDKLVWTVASLKQLLDAKFNDLASIVIQVASGKKPKEIKRGKLEDYVIRFGDDTPPPPRRTQSTKEQWDILTMWAMSHQARPQAQTPQERLKDKRKSQAATAKQSPSLNDRRKSR